MSKQNAKMKILVHSHLFPNPQQKAKGTFVYYQVLALKNLGCEIVVVAPVPYVPPGIPQNHPWHKYKHVPNMSVKDGLRIYYPRFISIPKKKFLFLRGKLIFWSAAKFYSNLINNEKFDLIHCHQIIPDGHVGYILSRKFDIQFGVTIHGIDIYEQINIAKKNFTLVKLVAENASFVGVVSKRLKDLISSHKIVTKEKTTKIIYNGINTPEESKNVRWPDKKNNVIRVLSVGRVTRKKGYDYVMQALGELRNKHRNLLYYIIGDGVDLPYFQKVAENEKVSDITFFLGEKTNSEVMGYLKSCDIFVLPSRNESFGIVYIEAMYMKKIVIGSKGEGIEEIIKDNKNGFLVEPRNVLELKSKLDYIISNIDRLRCIGEKAFHTVWPKLSWENNAKNYISLYKAIQ